MSPALCSFRDPDGSVFSDGSRIFRRVSDSGAATLDRFLGTQTATRLIASGKLVRTWQARDVELPVEDGGDACILEHDRIWFPSYPHEWPPEMLVAAAELTLELARAALSSGFGLKDATPANVLFRGPEPVFVDVLSFEERAPGDPIWLPHAQFLRMFVLPLLLSREFHIPPHASLFSHPNGIEPDTAYQMCSWRKRLAGPFFRAASMPVWLNRRANANHERTYSAPGRMEPAKARFILNAQLRSLERQLRRAASSGRNRSPWASYTETRTYTSGEASRKQAFVRDTIASLRPRTVLDVGCNTGEFSEVAAAAGAKVVAIDTDPVVAGETWRHASEKRLDILPLVVDISRPSPATGWRNAENLAFLDRAEGRFDLVMMLAVLHHLLVTERAPLDEVLSLAAHLSSGYVLIEYVSKEDPMFHRLARGRDALHANFTTEYFESACAKRFSIHQKVELVRDTRKLYLLKKHAA